MMGKKQSSTPSSTSSDLSDDPDTEEALKGFDFLASPDELDGSAESRSGEDSAEWGETGGLMLTNILFEQCLCEWQRTDTFPVSQLKK